ncbi:sulfite exporter TauE/SafE family protein [Massilia arenosa]|uniref:Probable membrane transporter protein n=1 Tax=Zemynaea arenosa TaxID=2561931 RepID=A0A4Y9S7M8_9BURK|nr:sulfite exporter TauE/SafE family protein [Massilia arenosa]TFW16050.1 sulfite exporter TauE/SafE family protein [Massilia arenosa]
MTLALLLGAAVGLILALTGAGGGILAVPALVFGVGLGVAQAGPIGLLSVGLAALLGALLGLRHGVVRYRAASLMAVTGVLVAPAGLWLAHHMSNRWLSVLFALVLMHVALRTLRQARGLTSAHRPTGHPCVRDAGTGRFIWTAPCARVLTLAGSAAGLLSGLLGVGGGFVMVPALRRYTDLDMQSTVATSLAVIGLVSAAGVAGSAIAGTLDWQVGLPFAAGALAGMLGGRPLARRLSGPTLQTGFAVLTAAVAVSMLVKALA